MKRLTFALILIIILVAFFGGKGYKADAQVCPEEVTPYGCGHYTHTQILVRAQPNGTWVIHNNSAHPTTNIATFTQESNRLEFTFTENNTKVLHISAQPSNVAGYKGLDIGVSGGISGISSYLGLNGVLVNPDDITDSNWLIWYYILGFVEAS